ncbi:TPA: hypothetical protein ACK3Q6_001635 [Burkholderia cepacia]|uniref:hypothetical protein n=1 Tax=Burkholderia cepacia TaxID=292 RepID=UPI001CF5FE4D|nr:hypothetical protein [Burkholderia cepacia]MCA8363179.1 hypothetical protein [Burkholderia cepacia]HDR9756487.1 hypothetical protein [Burkholderia cepacia ATCC 25416]HDV6364680.1 hypothetical protein [Burkholderia cepacia]
MLPVRNLRWLVVSLLFTQTSAFAATAILAPTDMVDRKCASEYRKFGLYCQREGEPQPDVSRNALGIPLRNQHQFDPPSMRVAAIMHLTPARTQAGTVYYLVSTERFKTGILSRDFSPTDRFEEETLAFIRDTGLPLADEDSERAKIYLGREDEKTVAYAAREADTRARQAQEQERQEYANSPAGKAAAAKEAVAQCRRTIANAQHALAQDRRIAAVSGTTDLLLRRQAGTAIVNCQDVIARGGYPLSQ